MWKTIQFIIDITRSLWMVRYRTSNWTALRWVCNDEIKVLNFKPIYLIQPSTGYVWTNLETNYDTKRIVEAKADIPNASNLSVWVVVEGFSSYANFGIIQVLRPEIPYIKPRSSAIICATVRNQRHTQKYKKLVNGRRVQGDLLVRFERHEVRAGESQFPSHIFQFSDDQVHITAVELRTNVSNLHVNCARIWFYSLFSPEFAVTNFCCFL